MRFRKHLVQTLKSNGANPLEGECQWQEFRDHKGRGGGKGSIRLSERSLSFFVSESAIPICSIERGHIVRSSIEQIPSRVRFEVSRTWRGLRVAFDTGSIEGTWFSQHIEEIYDKSEVTFWMDRLLCERIREALLGHRRTEF
jgi:hypothetical protein